MDTSLKRTPPRSEIKHGRGREYEGKNARETTMKTLWSEVKQPGGTVCNTKGNICYGKSVMTHWCLRLSFRTEIRNNNVGKDHVLVSSRPVVIFNNVQSSITCNKQTLLKSWWWWQFLAVIKSQRVVPRQIFTKLEWPCEKRAVNEMGCNWISIAEMYVSWFAYSVVYC